MTRNAILAALVCLVVGFYVGRATSDPDIQWRTVTEQVVRTDTVYAAPPEFYAGDEADTVERVVVHERVIRDTLRVPVPAELTDTRIGLVNNDRPVGIIYPPVGNPRVEVTTYPVGGGAFERRTYTVDAPAFKYGLEVELGVSAPVTSNGDEPGLGVGGALRGYLGYKATHAYAGIRAGPEGVRWETGVRLRLGR